MGLCVVAYSSLVLIDAVFDRFGNPISPVTRERIDDYLIVGGDPDFPYHTFDLCLGGVYKYFEKFRFYAGSYSTYTAFRNELARLAGYPAVQDESAKTYKNWAGAFRSSSGPFHELLRFSDCDGIIGPTYSKKILEDFKEWDSAARQSEVDGFYETYNDFKTAFAFASGCGAVEFC